VLRLSFNFTGAIIPVSVWTDHLQRIRRELKTRLVVILITAFPTPAAWVVRVWNERQRRGRERQQAVELLAALRRPAYAARAAKTVRAQESMYEKTAVLKIVPKKTVYSSVYHSASHPVDDALAMSLMSDLLNDDTGDIRRSA